MSTITTPRVEFDQDVELRRIDDDADYSGWFCIRTEPFPCPAPGCDFVAYFQTAAHLIVVWPSRDDPKLLATAYNANLAGRDPKIVEYEPGFGSCIPWDVWWEMGGPVHGWAPRPDGWEENRLKRL